MTALAMLRLLPEAGQITEGTVSVDGLELMCLPEAAMRKVRGRRIAMIFQEPATSLNPVLTVGRQICEVLERHLGLAGVAARQRALGLLDSVGMPDAARRLEEYPFQLSGGLKQRVMIAIALAAEPELLIADEPTTALDVTIQAQILDLLGELKSRMGMAVMLITHAMGVIAETAQRVVVMYAGKVVEEAPVRDLFASPRHPYTQGLIRSIPRIDTAIIKKIRLEAIAGTVPSLLEPAPGCRFAPRCRYARAECSLDTPALREIVSGHKVACFLAEEAGMRVPLPA
jgi:peptide/nickel transport system ATP-binding protein